MNRAELNKLHTRIFESASEVYSVLGPGLDTQIYHTCFQHELRMHGLMFKKDVLFPVIYKEIKTSHELKVELLVENQVLVEIKNTETILQPDVTKMTSKLKITGRKMGIIITFNASGIIEGYRKVLI